MNPDDIQSKDLILLPKKGTLESRTVLVVKCEPTMAGRVNPVPVIDPSTGEYYYDVTFLNDDGRHETRIMKSSSITLVGRKEDMKLSECG